jgi:peptidyl-prolyl cis-trans isomerase B (cyclophilin B)
VPSADKRQRKKENARIAREAREAAEKRRKRLRMARNVGLVAVVFVGGILLINWLQGGSSKKAADTSTTSTPTTVSKPEVALDPSKTYTATVGTNFGPITIALDTKTAPTGSARFIKLARAGVYNGSRWHRIVKDFVIQGGAPGGNPNRNYPSSVVAEVPKDHYPVGAVAAAKTGNDPSGTFNSQFFVVTGQAQGASLPNDYARFGTVKSGMSVVDKIGSLPTNASQEPTQKATITKVTISES